MTLQNLSELSLPLRWQVATLEMAAVYHPGATVTTMCRAESWTRN